MSEIDKLERFLLQRKYYAEATVGQWTTKNGVILCETLERPRSFDGKENLSDDPTTSANESCCIPEGVYPVIWSYSNRLKHNTFEILNVPNRSGIRIHPANVISELLGCIAPCRFISKNTRHTDGKIYSYYANASREALEILETKLPKEFILEIKS